MSRSFTLAAAATLGAVLACGCGSSPSRRPRPRSVKALLEAVREGRTPLDPDIQALSAWLSKAIVKGTTRRSDVVTLFGKHHKDLDRPDRDGVKTWEYYLGPRGSNANWYYLVFDFDAKTGIVVDWSISHAICGFCPHVFADDGRWRLEGKILAGRVGQEREGADALLLPRLRARDGRLRVMLANLAPETEYLDRVELGSVPLRPGEELDVSLDGQPVVWTPVREYSVRVHATEAGRAEATVEPEAVLRGGDVIVVEVRNTSAFEAAMRAAFLEHAGEPRQAALTVLFDQSNAAHVQPVGTKFLRRVVIPVPRKTRTVTLTMQGDLWSVRRLWVGARRQPRQPPLWRGPSGPLAPPELKELDGQRLCLGPNDEVVLEFAASQPPAPEQRVGHVLRVWGYYVFAAAPGRE